MHLDDDAGRDFEGLDVRETQAALAEELEGEEINDETMDKDVELEGVEVAVEEDQAADDAGAPAADPVWNAAQEAEHLRLVEALLFAASEPLDEKTIAARLPEGVDIKVMLETLSQHYENRGVNLTKVSGKWRFVTSPRCGACSGDGENRTAPPVASRARNARHHRLSSALHPC